MNASAISTRLESLGNPEKANLLQGFFKTAPGQYGHGDIFLGITVPVIRKLTKEYDGLPLSEVTQLLHSPFHEARLLALLLLVRAYSRADAPKQEQIYNLYLQNTRYTNNWDLVDCSAEHIVGAYLKDRSKAPLHALAKSQLLWERRISIIATFHYIKRGQFTDTLQIAERLLHDPEDLIHKAVGWMLRELGKRDQTVEESFLQQHCTTMPRTMLRYAIERFPEPLRLQYLRGQISH